MTFGYKTQNVVDKQLAGFEHQAAIILRSREVATVDNMHFVQMQYGAICSQVESSDEEGD